MSLTPSAGTSRPSGIPTPGRSSIPTPGRLRSPSLAASQQHSSASASAPDPTDHDFIQKAFADAIKANDPAAHRSTRLSDVTVSSSLSPSSSISSHRSIQSRPPSVASSSSAISPIPPRTPVSKSKSSYSRPPSRSSDVFARSSSRADRAFEPGDDVRIESLGYEGVLRYLGEIEGKPGEWAGVELSGGFVGRGKNDGSVNGIQYFTCPPNCGVFVAATKLSAATVGPSVSRPSSVASSRNGRITPLPASGRITPTTLGMPSGRKSRSGAVASSGRITPSLSTGRVTPSTTSGRWTPGSITPAARPRSSFSKTLVRGHQSPAPITPGSRASRYVGITARQLNTSHGRDDDTQHEPSGSESPTPSKRVSSPSLDHSSPRRIVSMSPYATPKAGSGARSFNLGGGMPSTTSLNHSRAASAAVRPRVPSTVAMPPPASPSLPGRLTFQEERHSSEVSASDLALNGKVLQERIARLITEPLSDALHLDASEPQTESLNTREHFTLMQARVQELEEELASLRTGSEHDKAEALKNSMEQQERLSNRILELENRSRTFEKTIDERDATIETLERSIKQNSLDAEKIKSESDACNRDLQARLDDRDALVAQLRILLEEKDGLQTENDAVIRAKETEIALLETRVQKAYIELEEERKELGMQVDELRKAGQETIALYEERLSTADSRRYEAEEAIATLQEQLRTQARPSSPSTITSRGSSAIEIDNESLREQVLHLQKKLSAMEDLLEDARIASEREEFAMQERIQRYKEKEDVIRQELSDSKKEMERLGQSEGRATQRVEEMEEALRENTVALENARAEIEMLRTEIADLESKAIASHANADSPSVPHRIIREHTLLTAEVALLKQQLSKFDGLQQDSSSNLASFNSDEVVERLSDDIKVLTSEKTSLEQLCNDRESELVKERQQLSELKLRLEERNLELDTLRKRYNRDLPINGLEPAVVSPASPISKHEMVAARDENTGLKHIIQELQKENSVAAQHNKVLESENKLLLVETERLREDLKTLEDVLEESILRQETSFIEKDFSSTSAAADVTTLQKELRDIKARYEADLEQMRKKQVEAEMKSARTVHELNKEIGELESLIETKIYREDELEREVDRLKDKLTRIQKKSSKTSEEYIHHPKSEGTAAVADSELVCEICEQRGHDIFTCSLLRDEPTSASSVQLDTSQQFCVDCEERGHTAASCPHSLDVF